MKHIFGKSFFMFLLLIWRTLSQNKIYATLKFKFKNFFFHNLYVSYDSKDSQIPEKICRETSWIKYNKNWVYRGCLFYLFFSKTINALQHCVCAKKSINGSRRFWKKFIKNFFVKGIYQGKLCHVTFFGAGRGVTRNFQNSVSRDLWTVPKV